MLHTQTNNPNHSNCTDDTKIIFPKEVEFYIGDEKNQLDSTPKDTDVIMINKSLRKLVENSDLFTKEDKQRFVFE